MRASSTRRFTDPVWIENAPGVDQVTIRVRIEDSQREEAVTQEFERWCASALPLALFRCLRCIELAGQRLEVLSQEPGPVPRRTRILRIGAAGSAAVITHLVARGAEGRTGGERLG